MTEPLIDVDELIDAYWSGTHEDAKDRVMDYLRSVLTPETLEPTEWVSPDPESSIGTDLHRHIFGEDE